MTYRLVIQPEAEADLDEAYRWYENQRSGLGGEFIGCVEAVFERICETPELHAVVYQTVRPVDRDARSGLSVRRDAAYPIAGG